MEYVGTIMTPEQIAQLYQRTLETPLNTLIAILALLAIIVCIVVVGSVIFLAWKFGTPLIKQYQQQLDTNKRLTDIAEQNTKQVAIQQTTADTQTNEMKRQTVAIDAQTIEIKSQSEEFRKASAQIAANTASVNAFEVILKSALEALPEQIILAVENRMKCTQLIQDVQALRYEVSQVLNQQQSKRSTSTQPIIPVVKVDGESS